jgi:AraC-like DNA-binding protein
MNRIQLLSRALELIDHNLTRDLTATSLAYDLGYSRSALDRLFVETLGDTPARFRKHGEVNPLFPVVTVRQHELQPARTRVVTVWQSVAPQRPWAAWP